MSNTPIYLQISEEEHAAVLQKIIDAVQKPAGHLPKQDELYLEQQLSDMLGFQVVAELEGHRLNHSIGKIKALAHLRRYPTDQLALHDEYREAGLEKTRGMFGWFTQMGQLTSETRLAEKYFLAVQADFVEGWPSLDPESKNWYKWRKMIVINPAEERAVVGKIGTIGPAEWMQYQFGASPEVVREGLLWSIKSRGKVFVLFVDDEENKVPLGVIDLRYK